MGKVLAVVKVNFRRRLWEKKTPGVGWESTHIVR